MTWTTVHLLDDVATRLQETIGDLIASDRFEPPRLPHLAQEIIALAADANVSFRQIAGMVARDQFLAARVFKLANSVYYRGLDPCTKLSVAMTRIGLNGLKQLVMMYSVRGRVFESQAFRRIMTDLWRHALTSAVACDVVAKTVNQPTETAFVAGLLHDIGAPVVLGVIADYADRDPAFARIDPDMAWRLVDRLHNFVGGQVGRAWNLPPVLVEVIEKHHHIFDISGKAQFHIQLVKAGDALSRQLGVGYSNGSDHPVGDSYISALTGFHLAPDQMESVRQAIQTKLAVLEGL